MFAYDEAEDQRPRRLGRRGAVTEEPGIGAYRFG